MAEGGEYEMEGLWGEGDPDQIAETDFGGDPFLEPSMKDASNIAQKEGALPHLAGESLARARQELLKTKVEAFFKTVEDKSGVKPLGLDLNEFDMDANNNLFLKKGGGRVRVRLTSTRDPSKFLALSGLQKEIGLRGVRGLFPDYDPARMSTRQTKALSEVKDKIPTDLSDDAIEGAANETDTAVKQLFHNVGSNTDGLPMRELIGLDKALRTQRGALANNIAKLNELADHIALEERKLNEPEITEDVRELIRERLRSLRDEHATRLEAAAANREALRSQISRVRETITRVLNEDTTLAERIRTLFREQGVTIASLLTALGFIISTIALSITGGGVPPPVPASNPSGGAKEWVKKQLETLGQWLKSLASKAAAALPGVIGTAVSWLLKTAGGVTVWMAEHLWALAAALVVGAAVAIKKNVKLN